MRIALLGSSQSWHVRDLERAAGGRHEVVCLSYQRLAARVGGGPEAPCFGQTSPVIAAESVLAEFDAVLLRSFPAGSLEQVIFRMDALARLEAAGTLVVNPPRSIEVAVDKFLASARLAAAGLPTPPTVACQTVADALEAFDVLGGDCVLKPLFGSEGRGLTRISDRELAWRAFQLLQQQGSVIYLQPFLPHPGRDVRALVLGQQVWAIARQHPHDWRTNVSRGAVATPLDLPDAWRAMALQAAAAVGATMAGVDLLPSDDGQVWVLEVNAVPGWRALSTTLGVDVAGCLLEHLESRIGRKAEPAKK